MVDTSPGTALPMARLLSLASTVFDLMAAKRRANFPTPATLFARVLSWACCLQENWSATSYRPGLTPTANFPARFSTSPVMRNWFRNPE